ncbi:MAG: hypothetical protein LIP08_05470 [Bacteroides sp.]|nr:hypothetical protein [Bacteroides sp.]
MKEQLQKGYIGLIAVSDEIDVTTVYYLVVHVRRKDYLFLYRRKAEGID